MLREIITINEALCDGCGNCIPGCPEGALQIIDGKARLVSDLMCDGLGACVGDCPTGALKVEKKEAEAYDETKVMANIVKQGPNTIKAHLRHLKEHGEQGYLGEAVTYLLDNGFNIPDLDEPVSSGRTPVIQPHAHSHHSGGGCPGSRTLTFQEPPASRSASVQSGSALRQWPVQLALLNPQAPYFQKCDLVVAADCVAFSLGDFHSRFLAGRSLAILCPKLDSMLDSYLEKLTELFRTMQVKSVTVLKMEVPCCSGVRQLVERALQLAGSSLQIQDWTVSLQGEVFPA